MKSIEPTQKKNVSSNLNRVHYLHFGDTSPHRPCPHPNGIHCEGEKFGYIVDWEVPAVKKERTHKN